MGYAKWEVGSGYTSWGSTSSTNGWGNYSAQSVSPYTSTASFVVSPGKTDIARVGIACWTDRPGQTGNERVITKNDGYSSFKLLINNNIDLPATVDGNNARFIFNNNSKQVLCQYIRDAANYNSIDIDIYFMGYSTANNSWVQLGITDNIIKGDNVQRTPTCSAVVTKVGNNWNFYRPDVTYITQYNSAQVACTMVTDWVTKTVTFTPSSAMLGCQAVTYNVPYAGTNSVTTTHTFTTSVYPDSYVGDSHEIGSIYGEMQTDSQTWGKVTPLVVTNKTNLWDTSYQTGTTVYVYKYMPIDIDGDYEVTRCDQLGNPSLKGDYIKVSGSLVYNAMKCYAGIYNYGRQNPLTITTTVRKVVDGTVVYSNVEVWDTCYPEVDNNFEAWISQFDIENGVSYLVSVAFSDVFRTRSMSGTIHTYPIFIDWGPANGHMSIGKYIETDGLEIQFPTTYNKDVYFIGANGVIQNGEAAQYIPYTDTYGIGARNVQEALEWLQERLG